MKTAYELAMERLNKAAPMAKLSAGQKQQLADLDSKYTAKIAEREIAIRGEITQATAQGDLEKAAKLQEELTQQRTKLQAELEEKKAQVRQAAKS